MQTGAHVGPLGRKVWTESKLQTGPREPTKGKHKAGTAGDTPTLIGGEWDSTLKAGGDTDPLPWVSILCQGAWNRNRVLASYVHR